MENNETRNIKITVIDNEKIKDDAYCEIMINMNFLYGVFCELLIMDSAIPRLDVQLTKREKEVLAYLAKGKSNKQIANEMHFSVHTTKAHLQNIFEKLKVNDRTQAVVKAIQHNIISLFDEDDNALSC